MENALKSALIAAAILFPVSMATAQNTPPSKPPVTLEVIQVLGINKVDASVYDLSIRLADGSTVDLRMNAFVAQDLARQLGNYKR